MHSPVKESSVALANRSVARQTAFREHREGVSRRTALLDARGVIIAVDADWSARAKEKGIAFLNLEPGIDYLEICRNAGKSAAEFQKAVFGIQSVINGDIPSFTMDYTSPSVSGHSVFRMRATPIVYENARVVVTHTDITALPHETGRDLKKLQQFAQRLIDAHDQERQQLSQDIHDDLGNRIALIAFSLRQAMKQDRKAVKAREKELNRVLAEVTELSASLRNISHHLYPPTLRYAGIRAALKLLMSEYEKTHQMEIELAIPEDSPRLPNDVGLCIYRIAQECLENVVRHSGTRKARITLVCNPEHISLIVSDAGQGFVRSQVALKGGLGLLSMEERALKVGGYFTVKSAHGLGTEIYLTVPTLKEWGMIE
jgi:signal transduction histidine kinase